MTDSRLYIYKYKYKYKYIYIIYSSHRTSTAHEGSLLLDQESVEESLPWESSNASLGLLEAEEPQGLKSCAII